jgi:hypothetical protein
MRTISITTVSATNGDRLYRAVMGSQQSTGKTAGEALDALTVQMGSTEVNGFLLLPNFQPDQFFTAHQQQRLTELMNSWRVVRDRGEELPPEQQAELDNLIETDLLASEYCRDIELKLALQQNTPISQDF